MLYLNLRSWLVRSGTHVIGAVHVKSLSPDSSPNFRQTRSFAGFHRGSSTRIAAYGDVRRDNTLEPILCSDIL